MCYSILIGNIEKLVIVFYWVVLSFILNFMTLKSLIFIVIWIIGSYWVYGWLPIDNYCDRIDFYLRYLVVTLFFYYGFVWGFTEFEINMILFYGWVLYDVIVYKINQWINK